MAYIYDYQANPQYGYEDEETRRRREEERRIAEEQGLVPPTPVEQIPPPPGPVQPPASDLNRYLQQNESGSNPNVGYHFPQNAQGQRRSTAYGSHGITQPAYRDIQQADPYFANRAIESLNLQEQDRAQTVYNNVLSRQLKSQGVEPTPANLAQANFIGAKGLADFQRTGYISPAAAQANGGAENVKRILANRSNFQPAPTSGAAVEAGQGAPIDPEESQRRAEAQTQSQYALANFARVAQGLKVQQDPMMAASETFVNRQDDPYTLIKMRDDTTQPEWRRRAASEQLYGLISNEQNIKQGQERLQELSQRMAQNDRRATNELTKEINKEDGSWLKYALWSLLGAKDLANQEEVKLGIGDRWTQSSITMPDGTSKTVEVLMAKDGSIRRARDIGTDEAIDPKLLSQISIGQKGVEQGAEVYMDPTGRVKGTFVLERRPGQTPIYKEIGTGRSATSAESAVLRKTGVQGTLEDQRVRLVQKMNLELQGKTAAEQMIIQRKYNEELIGQGMAPLQPSDTPLIAPQIGGQAPAPTTGAAPAPTTGAAPAPTTQAAPAPTTGVRPTTTQIAAGKEEAKDFVKYKGEDIADKASKGSQINTIRKEQLYGADGILQNPELVGFLQATGGPMAEAGNILRDMIAGNFKSVDDLSGRIGQLNLSQRQKDVLYRQINLSRQIDPLTLKTNAGAGAVSDAEQRANKQANIDIARQTLYSAATDMTRQQFYNDLASARLAFANNRPDLNTRSKFDAAWSAEKRKIEEQYAKIFEARAAYIQKYNPDGRNPGAVVDAFKHYPVPEWNSQSGSWDLKTEFNRRAVRPRLNEFVR